MPSTVSDADIDALFVEIETLHAETKELRMALSKQESRISVLENTKLVRKSSTEKLYKTRLPPAVSLIRNPED